MNRKWPGIFNHPGKMLFLIWGFPAFVASVSLSILNEEIGAEIMKMNGFKDEANFALTNKFWNRVSKEKRPSMHRIAENFAIPEMASLPLHPDLQVFEGIKFDDKKEALDLALFVKSSVLKGSEVEEALDVCLLEIFLSSEMVSPKNLNFLLVQMAKRPEYWLKLVEIINSYPELFGNAFSRSNFGLASQDYPNLWPFLNANPEVFRHLLIFLVDEKATANNDFKINSNVFRWLMDCELTENLLQSLLPPNNPINNPFLRELNAFVCELLVLTKDLPNSSFSRLLMIKKNFDNGEFLLEGALNLMRIRFDPEYDQATDMTDHALAMALYARKYRLAADISQEIGWQPLNADLAVDDDQFCQFVAKERRELLDSMQIHMITRNHYLTMAKCGYMHQRPHVHPQFPKEMFFGLNTFERHSRFGKLFKANLSNTELLVAAFESLETHSVLSRPVFSQIAISVNDLLQVSPKVLSLMHQTCRFQKYFYIEVDDFWDLLGDGKVAVSKHISLAKFIPPLQVLFTKPRSYLLIKKFMQLSGRSVSFKEILCHSVNAFRRKKLSIVKQFWMVKSVLELWLDEDDQGYLESLEIKSSSDISELLNDLLESEFEANNFDQNTMTEIKGFISRLSNRSQLIMLMFLTALFALNEVNPLV